jgi:hypothetical protein
MSYVVSNKKLKGQIYHRPFLLPTFNEYCNIGGMTTKSPPVFNLTKYYSVVDHVIKPAASFAVY